MFTILLEKVNKTNAIVPSVYSAVSGNLTLLETEHRHVLILSLNSADLFGGDICISGFNWWSSMNQNMVNESSKRFEAFQII